MEKVVGLNKRAEQDFLARLDAMPFEEARENILKHDFGFSLEHPWNYGDSLLNALNADGR
jgi:hypothetical protein